MSTQLQKTKTGQIVNYLQSEAGLKRFIPSLPTNLPAEKFTRALVNSINKNPKVAECTLESILECADACASAGIIPDGRLAHLIPYKTKCTLIIDYKGYVVMARRSGEIATIHAEVVCDNDEFNHSKNTVSHAIDWKSERGAVYAVFVEVTFKDGSTQVDVMSKAEVEAIRKRSRSGTNGPWVTDWNEMAKKTVFKRAVKWLNLSSDDMVAIMLSDNAEFGGMRNATPQVRTEPTDPFADTQQDTLELTAETKPAVDEDFNNS
jgi:recombination protein RecT